MLKVFVSALLFLPLVGCLVGAPPPSAVGLYGPNPELQDIPGSNGQGLVTRTVEFTSEEVYEATNTAMLRLGYDAEIKDKNKGMVAGSGFYECAGSLRPPVTMAIYIKQIDTNPTSKITVLVDRHDIQCWGTGETLAANQLVGEILKVLSTY